MHSGVILAFFTALLATSCSSGEFSGSSKTAVPILPTKSAEIDSATADAGAISAETEVAPENIPAPTDGEEDELARPAEVVTGSWLTCGTVNTGVGSEDSIYGCGYYVDGKKQSLKIDTWHIVVTNISSGSQITPTLTMLPAGSVWHIQFPIAQDFATEAVTISATIAVNGGDFKNQVNVKATRQLSVPGNPPILSATLERAFLLSFNFTYVATGTRAVKLNWVWPTNASDFMDFTIRYRPGQVPPKATCDDGTDQIEGPTTIISSFNGQNHTIDLDKSGCACSFRVCVRDKNLGLYSGHTASPP